MRNCGRNVCRNPSRGRGQRSARTRRLKKDDDDEDTKNEAAAMKSQHEVVRLLLYDIPKNISKESQCRFR